MTPETVNFIKEHSGDDPTRLLLARHKYPDVDMDLVVTTIVSRKRLKGKVPSWAQCPSLVFPLEVSAQQCSSEPAALYKLGLVERLKRDSGNADQMPFRITDLTAGLGVDGWIMGRAATQLTLVERLKELCEALRHNYGELGAPCPTTVFNSDCETFLAHGAQPCDIIYIDPARRDEQSRVFKIEDCSPDILSLKQQMFEKAPTVIAKLSPMVDIGDTIKKIPEISEIHVVSIHNECKEVLVVMQREKRAERVRLIAADIPSGVGFEMDYGSEQEASALVAESIGKYIFQPYKAVMKLGAFRTLSREYGLGKLETSTHLYTSDTLPYRPFPGRTFTVTEVLDFSSSSIKTFSKRHHRCNLLALNMPMDTATLRSRMGIKEGGDTTTFVCATAFGPKIIVCEPLLRPGDAPTGF